MCEQIPGGLLSHHVVRLRQKAHTDLGLSLRFVPLVAFTETERTWAETINTAGYQGLFLPWQEHHSTVLPWLQDIPLPSSQRHFPQDPWRQRARARTRWGCLSSFHTHPTREITGLGHFPALQSHTTEATGETEKKNLHKTNPGGFPHSNPLPRVRYLPCFSHLLF